MFGDLIETRTSSQLSTVRVDRAAGYHDMAVTLDCTYSSTLASNLTAPRSLINCSVRNEFNSTQLPNDMLRGALSQAIEKWFYMVFYPLVLAFGTACTLLTLWVVFTLKRQRLYENLTYTLVFMSFAGRQARIWAIEICSLLLLLLSFRERIADLFALLIGATRNWALVAFGYNLRVSLDDIGLACKGHVFLVVVTRDFAVLLKVVLCLSQLIAVFPSLNRERAFRDPIRTLNVLIAAAGVLCLARSALAAFSHEIVKMKSKSGNEIHTCAVYEKPLLEKLNGYSTSGFLIVTYPLIILCNIIFLFKACVTDSMHCSNIQYIEFQALVVIFETANYKSNWIILPKCLSPDRL